MRRFCDNGISDVSVMSLHPTMLRPCSFGHVSATTSKLSSVMFSSCDRSSACSLLLEDRISLSGSSVRREHPASVSRSSLVHRTSGDMDPSLTESAIKLRFNLRIRAG